MHMHDQITTLREWMKGHGLNAFVFPSTDPHSGEYVPEHWMTRQWISGFDGSAGTAVVTLQSAALWTDSRYFLAAAEQLQDTPFLLMKDGLSETPSIAEWLCEQLHAGETAGMDGAVISCAESDALRKTLEAKGIMLDLSHDPAAQLWEQRPPMPQGSVQMQPLSLAGETTQSKMQRVRLAIRKQGADAIIVTALDEIAWLLNLRGCDVHCNPVFVGFVLLTQQTTTLFIDRSKLGCEVMAYLRETDVDVQPYDGIREALGCCEGDTFLLDPATTSHALRAAMPHSCRLVTAPSPVAAMKAIKNSAEIEGFRQAMLRDGVAMVRFLMWLESDVEAGGETEMSISRKLTALRAEQPLFRGLSFDTIAGYGPHGAIVHYEATPKTDATLAPHGLLLLDSGAQYQDGTTDITRTIALGPLTEQERLDYTLVLKGHIRLAMTRFPDGICGTQIDALARYAMWQHGINYGHGTGHGVGAYLNVHEGPHQIRSSWKPAPLHAGMTVTNEPGIYRAGSHGVRIENTMLIVEDGATEFGTFLRLEPLTLCPIDLTPVLWQLMEPDEVDYLNAYHQRVCESLAPLLTEEERDFVRHYVRRALA